MLMNSLSRRKVWKHNKPKRKRFEKLSMFLADRGRMTHVMNQCVISYHYCMPSHVVIVYALLHIHTSTHTHRNQTYMLVPVF